jgi:hypothetical protein
MTVRGSSGPKRRDPATPHEDDAKVMQTNGRRVSVNRLLFLVVAAVVVVYANSPGGQLLVDDAGQIVANLRLRSWSNLPHAFTSDSTCSSTAASPSRPSAPRAVSATTRG